MALPFDLELLHRNQKTILDHNGEKISKSIGNGISVDDWLDFAPQESLELFMFQSPRKAKRLYFDSIPKSTDEFIKYKNQYLNQNEDERKNNPTWFINLKDKEIIPRNGCIRNNYSI